MSENGIAAKNQLAVGGRIRLMGLELDNLSMAETLACVEELIRSPGVHQHVVVNVNKIIKSRRDPKLQAIINGSSLINADGMPVVWASRLFGKALKERVAGIDLFVELLKRSSQAGYRVYFLGAREDVLTDLVEVVRRRFLGIQIAGRHNGYWAPEEEAGVIEHIRTAKPDIVFVAMPSPKKEYFIAEHLKEIGAPFVMGVGGSFDVLAGRSTRAPKWMQNCGLEWFHRFLQEPGRLFGRYFIEGLAFLGLLIQEPFRKR